MAAMVVGIVPSIATTIHGALQFFAPASSSSAVFDGGEDSSANRRRKMQPSFAGSMTLLNTAMPQQ
jgi:hypothetical protein